MVRVAAALALALLVQGAFAAPSCGCAGPITFFPYPLPGDYPAGVDTVGAANPVLDDYPDALGTYHAALAGFAYEPDAVTPLSLAAPYASTAAPLAPDGGPQVVGASTGPTTAYTTDPVTTFELPVNSANSAVAVPVSVSHAIVDGAYTLGAAPFVARAYPAPSTSACACT